MRLLKAVILAAVILAAVMAPMLWMSQPAQAAGEDGVRDTITVTTVLATGITNTLAAASGDGHKFINQGTEFIYVLNSYTATITMTVVTGGRVNGVEIDDVDVAVGAGVAKLVGPFPMKPFNQLTDAGKVYINWSAAVTGTAANSVTLAVYKVRS